MASEWHYCRDGETYGPVSSADLKKLAATGKLLRTDLLWKEGMADWKPADQFPKLFPEEEAASVIVFPEESAEDPLASLKFDVTPSGKKAVKAKTAASVADGLASLKVDVGTAGRKAASKVKSHARTAGKVAALSAERAKISTATLPIAYAELGEHCYRSRLHAEEFADLFTKLDAVSAGIAASKQPTEAGGDTIAEKAKAWAEQGMQFAQSQAQGVQAKTLFVQLGKACFNRFGPESGPGELVTRIQALRDRLSTLDAEVKTGVKKTGGVKGWLMYGGGALVCLMLISSCFSDKDSGGGGGGGGWIGSREPRPTNAKYLKLPKDSIVRQSYERGWRQGLEASRSWLNVFEEIDQRKDLDESGRYTGRQLVIEGVRKSLNRTEQTVFRKRLAHREFRQRFGKDPWDEMQADLSVCEGLLEGQQALIRQYLKH